MTQFTDWQSWIVHFTIFMTLGKWSGLKWQWAILLVIGIEVWECLDWTKMDFVYWFTKYDTWADIAAGFFGIALAEKLKCE